MKRLEPKTQAHKIVEDELRLLARVTAALSGLSTDNPGAPDYDEALISLRDQIAEAKTEDIPALVEQMTRISAIAQSYGSGRDLPVDPTSPYFGHLRLEDSIRIRDVLIGKRGYIDRHRNIQIVDWRNAPVSRIYYRYEEGDDYDESFGDRNLAGYVSARRNLTIDNSQLRRIGCPQGTFLVDGDGHWYEADQVFTPTLSGGQGKAPRPLAFRHGNQESKLGLHSGPKLRADKHLPEIAALIDPKQFELITQPNSGLVILQGCAGTGKTTVALHRVAYLNYAMPGRFQPHRILVVVPTRAMERYVELVLPSLGVKGVHVLTASRWLEKTRHRILPSSTQKYNEDTPATVLRFKKHPMLLYLLQDYVAEQRRQFTQHLVKSFQGKAIPIIEKWESLNNEPLISQCDDTLLWLNENKKISSSARQRAKS
ncbi:MAG: hypothetical protein V1754_08705, partial [Pseudomonadota bacterium]